jgi:hypothetical protein
MVRLHTETKILEFVSKERGIKSKGRDWPVLAIASRTCAFLMSGAKPDAWFLNHFLDAPRRRVSLSREHLRISARLFG